MLVMTLSMLGMAVLAHGAPADWTGQARGPAFATDRGWMVVPSLGQVTRSLDLVVAPHTPSEPGEFAQWATRLERPPGPAHLRFHLADDFTGPTAGYHFVQVLLDEQVLWERDVAGSVRSPERVEVALPPLAGEGPAAQELAFRLYEKRAVSNFPVRVQIAGVELVTQEAGAWLLPLESPGPMYREWPPDIPLEALPPQEGWAQAASIVQPWSATQTVAVREAEYWAPRFANELGFNAIIMLPPGAHNAIAAPVNAITEEQFRAALEAYRAHGLRFILYSAIMHCGHAPQWEDGLLAAEHPEWAMRDPEGGTITDYGHPWLCPSTGALEYTLAYTEALVRQYDADAVMLDNNQFMNSDDGRPMCYCAGCREGFRATVNERFGAEGVQDFLGLEPAGVEIPQSEDEPLWGLWLSWRKRAWAEAMETYRQRLREVNPEIVVLANTQYQYSSWVLAVDGQYPHADAVLSESRGMNAEYMASKMVLGRALAQGRPLWNYIGTFEEHDFSRLRAPEEVEGVVAASNAAGANPWIVFYGFEGEVNQPSVEALFRQMSFQYQHADLMVAGTERADVAVVLSPESRDLAGEPMPPRWLPEVLRGGFSVAGIWEPAGADEALLAGARMVVATSSALMRRSVAEDLAAWVRDGGRLIISPETGWRDEYGRWRDHPPLDEALGRTLGVPGVHEVGHGAVICVEAPEQVPEVIAGLVQPRIRADGPVGVHRRVAPDGRDVFSVASHAPGPHRVVLRMPEGVSEAIVLQPGRPAERLSTAQDRAGATVAFTMHERVALVVLGPAGQ